MLDAYLAQKGQLMGKQLYSIETTDEQCNPLLSIDQEQVVEWDVRNSKKKPFLVNFCHQLHTFISGMESSQSTPFE